MDYGKIFTRSWEVFWKHKILWVFGLLSGVFGGLSSIFSTFNSPISYSNIDYGLGEPPFSENTIEMLQWMTDHLVLFIVGIVVFFLVIMFLSILLGSFTSTGIIQGNLLLEAGDEELTFEKLMQGIRPYFWRVVGLNALLGVGGMGLMIVLFVVLFGLMIVTMGIGMLCFFPLFCILVPVTWFLTIVVTQAMVTIIAEDLGVIDSLKRGWTLVTTKIGPFLVVWLLVMVISFAVSLVLSTPAYIAMAPMYASMFAVESMQDPNTMFQVLEGSMIWLAVWGIIQSLLLGVLSVFITSIWVQTYLEARDDGTLEAPEQPEEAGPEPESLEQTT